MKILCIIDSLVSGGAQRQMTELAIGLSERNIEVQVVVYHEESFFLDDLKINNVKVIKIIENNPLKRIFKIRRYIRSENPHTVIAYLVVPSFIATLSGFPFRRWKLIVGERNADPKILKSIKQRFYRCFHIFATFVVGNSQSNINMVKKVNPFIPNSKLKVIYNIVNTDKFNIKNISNQSPITHFAAVGRYEYQKNYLGLIEALNILPNDIKLKIKINCYGHISEDNNYYKLLKEKIKTYKLEDVIVLNNAQKNISKVYYENDYILLVSHFEGFPNVVCEAMACSKPVLVSKVSDVPYFLEDNINGYFCNSNDIITIKEAIIKAIGTSTSLRQKMGENNLELVNNKFSSEKIINSYLNLILNN